MKKTKPSGNYQYFQQMHQDFGEAFTIINHYVMELYVFPKKIIEETEPVVERFIKQYPLPGAPKRNTTAFPLVIEFVDKLDDITSETFRLFEEHKTHLDESFAYIKKVSALKTKRASKKTAASEEKYVRLTPELMELYGGLRHLKEKADEMVAKLEKLELRWGRLKAKIKQ